METSQDRLSTVNHREEAILKMVGRAGMQSKPKLTCETNHKREGHHNCRVERGMDLMPGDTGNKHWEYKSP